MKNFVTSHNLKIDCEVINSANAGMTLKEHLNRFWEMGTLGIESNSAYETFKNEIFFNGQHYITFLPFKPYKFRAILYYQNMVYVHLKLN